MTYRLSCSAASSQARDRTRVPCIGRQILNHCATREAQSTLLIINTHTHTHTQNTFTVHASHFTIKTLIDLVGFVSAKQKVAGVD